MPAFLRWENGGHAGKNIKQGCFRYSGFQVDAPPKSLDLLKF